ncbi:CAMK family protein kinase [Tritrichomonas foetus]|uniref:CAMK family protein kinase n=1 Tax=Tritrichomonas foetus TaxID=1144522 RepID=A0A1J4KFF6_9EUKA|nr:CAMK family protein kinase [Tritrichomonas foetus]|eukprot:OHT10175.1 CAMK family protein kinase [Tritrichomonas foetus]
MSIPQFVGNYRVIRPIGTGAFAIVYLVERGGKHYAMKVIERQLDNLANVKFEANVGMFLNRLNDTPQLFEYFSDNDNYYMIFEFCQRGDMKNYIKFHSTMSEITAKPFIESILRGVHEVHLNGICHRDLKPENILITSMGKTKLADFGLAAKFETINGATSDIVKGCVGSPVYAAPELFLKSEYSGQKADAWSLGVTFYEMLTGRLPWKSQNNKKELINEIKTKEINFPSNMSHECINFLKGLLTIEPEKRMSLIEAINHDFFSDIKHRSSMDTFDLVTNFEPKNGFDDKVDSSSKPNKIVPPSNTPNTTAKIDNKLGSILEKINRMRNSS